MSALRRREVVRALLVNRGDLLVVAGLGSTAWDCAATGDHPLTFPMWGGMGCAAVTGLGLALAQPARRVLVVTGDGEMLMGLGSLATIGVQRPANLSVVVIDNERYGETGMQKTHTAHGVDLAAMARAAGFASAVLVREASAIESLRQAVHHGAGPHFAQVKVVAEKEAITLPPREGTLLKNRFREALLGASASLQ
ncbi:MAG: thiamine pyrophosphate-dependent enzyme [Betaproteobacteria bacterium]|nr:thiamine pyrophosphate-dependent enzyme [Betaproteobacteria bacterium]MDH5221996.1 thiamine pyrophosphate-dependent enzyme [Betaproteobacteria bacterium]MDH5349742.1 thiamine pyrophosphate-dependent enzyme [Betaproteobacteria bacterium]